MFKNKKKVPPKQDLRFSPTACSLIVIRLKIRIKLSVTNILKTFFSWFTDFRKNEKYFHFTFMVGFKNIKQ